jgi:hypothetical protein
LAATNDEVDLSVGILEGAIGIVHFRWCWTRRLFATIVVVVVVVIAMAVIMLVIMMFIAAIVMAVVAAIVVMMIIVSSSLRTMCGSRTGGWSLPCVMSD